MWHVIVRRECRGSCFFRGGMFQRKCLHTWECLPQSLKHSSITSSLSLLFTARLGDTSDLQSFIENLDRELAGINTVWWLSHLRQLLLLYLLKAWCDIIICVESLLWEYLINLDQKRWPKAYLMQGYKCRMFGQPQMCVPIVL